MAVYRVDEVIRQLVNRRGGEAIIHCGECGAEFKARCLLISRDCPSCDNPITELSPMSEGETQ